MWDSLESVYPAAKEDEEMQIIITIALLVVAILNLRNKK